MRVYAPLEAMAPAWEHTRALLWADRKWGRLLKLSLVAVFAELGSSFNFRVGSRLHGSAHPALLVVLTLIGLVFYVGFLYLGSRLQLTQFDNIVLRDPMVAPAWHRHGPHTWRWAGLRFTTLIATLLLLSPLLIPAIPILLAFAHAVQPVATAPGQMPHWNVSWQAILLLFVEVFAVVFAALMLARFIASLVLPGVAMEDLRFGPALRRGWQIFRADTPAMLLFAVLQPLVLLLLGAATMIALLFALVLLTLPAFLLGALLWAAVHKAGAAGNVAIALFAVIAGFIVLAVWLLLYLVAQGVLLTFSRAWSVYFLGGRYPLLGQYLEPDLVPAAWTPPPSLPPDDDNTGPDFPADPALA